MGKKELSRIKVLHIHTRGVIGGSGTNTLLTMLDMPKENTSQGLPVARKVLWLKLQREII